MEPKGSVHCSQEPATWPYPKIQEFNPHSHTILILSFHLLMFPKFSLFFRLSEHSLAWFNSPKQGTFAMIWTLFISSKVMSTLPPYYWSIRYIMRLLHPSNRIPPPMVFTVLIICTVNSSQPGIMCNSAVKTIWTNLYIYQDTLLSAGCFPTKQPFLKLTTDTSSLCIN
jgi:hypothetical protein